MIGGFQVNEEESYEDGSETCNCLACQLVNAYHDSIIETNDFQEIKELLYDFFEETVSLHEEISDEFNQDILIEQLIEGLQDIQDHEEDNEE